MDVLTVSLEFAEATRLAVLPDGDTCVVGCLTLGELYVASLRAGEVLRVLQAHHGSINGLSMASGGRLLSSASYDETVWVWDTGTWSQSMALEHLDKVWALASTYGCYCRHRRCRRRAGVGPGRGQVPRRARRRRRRPPRRGGQPGRPMGGHVEQ
ncbi:hypothetical protein GCM10009733_085740 [Nonomuraea maheshkhaliensis]|uniref:WD40 repeat domain-containing protein n=1 Tax=Nonomuraea maheshkhaliensis TaxID=419590 RepID=A0ABP4SQ43_9ACTN